MTEMSMEHFLPTHTVKTLQGKNHWSCAAQIYIACILIDLGNIFYVI